MDLELEALDELGVRAPRHLILEAMGRRANLILTGPDGRIVDCLRRVDAEMSLDRQVLPGLFYRLPPTQDKVNPWSWTERALRSWCGLPRRSRRSATSCSTGLPACPR